MPMICGSMADWSSSLGFIPSERTTVLHSLTATVLPSHIVYLLICHIISYRWTEKSGPQLYPNGLTWLDSASLELLSKVMEVSFAPAAHSLGFISSKQDIHPWKYYSPAPASAPGLNWTKFIPLLKTIQKSIPCKVICLVVASLINLGLRVRLQSGRGTLVYFQYWYQKAIPRKVVCLAIFPGNGLNSKCSMKRMARSRWKLVVGGSTLGNESYWGYTRHIYRWTEWEMGGPCYKSTVPLSKIIRGTLTSTSITSQKRGEIYA